MFCDEEKETRVSATMLGLPKKMLPMMILNVLREETDGAHTMTQEELRKVVNKRHEAKFDRKTIKRNLDNLIDMGFPIEYSRTTRMVPNPETGELEESVKTSDYWYAHDFTEPELRLLIDGLLFSKHLPYNQCRELVDKLAGQSSRYFKPHVRHVYTMPETLPQNPELFMTIEVLDEAIESKRKVAFRYLEYGTDGEQHPKRRGDGEVREYVASPYQMAAKEGKYYLICNYDKYDDISNYRVDRMADVRILEDEPAKPFESLEGAGRAGLDLAKYMAEHVYMYSSANSRCTFRIARPMISDVIDMFGRSVTFSDETDEHVTVSARVNERAMWQFAKNFAPDVLILEPKRLADQVREEAERTIQAYEALER